MRKYSTLLLLLLAASSAMAGTAGFDKVKVTSSTASTSSASGALIVTGGMGVGGAGYFGGALTAGTTTVTTSSNTTLQLNSTGAAVQTEKLQFVDTDAANTQVNWQISDNHATNGYLEFIPSTLAAGTTFSTPIVKMGATAVGIGMTPVKTLDITGTFRASGISTFSDTTDSSSVSTGAIVTSGGIGIAKKLYVGDQINETSTTDSSSISTGTIVTAGGIGVAKKLYVGTDLNVIANANFAGSTQIDSSGRIGGSSSPLSTAVFSTSGIGIGAGVIERGFYSNFSGNASATTAVRAFEALAGGGTGVATASVVNYYSGTISVGASSGTITRALELQLSTPSAGTNNASIADNITFSGNWFINQSGSNSSRLSGKLGIKMDPTNDLDITGTLGVTSTATAAGFISSTANVASAGQVRLASADTIKWRNNANDADISLSKSTANVLTWAGDAKFGGTSSQNTGVTRIDFNGTASVSISGTGGGTTGGGTATFTTGAGTDGLVLITDGSTGNACLGFIYSAASAFAIISDPASKFSTSAGTASKDNITIASGVLTIEHNSATSTAHSFRVIYFRAD